MFADKCPICGEKIVASCKCFRHDCQCINGHWWHTCLVHKKTVLGPSDHSKASDVCTCINNKE